MNKPEWMMTSYDVFVEDAKYCYWNQRKWREGKEKCLLFLCISVFYLYMSQTTWNGIKDGIAFTFFHYFFLSHSTVKRHSTSMIHSYKLDWSVFVFNWRCEQFMKFYKKKISGAYHTISKRKTR
jgi:hypothetical protein